MTEKYPGFQSKFTFENGRNSLHLCVTSTSEVDKAIRVLHGFRPIFAEDEAPNVPAPDEDVLPNGASW